MFYCDYNATFPLADSVRSELAKGFFFANTASQHSLGKKTAFKIRQVEEFLNSFFELDASIYQILFHSGATEASNLFFNTVKKYSPDDVVIFFSAMDHACVRSPVQALNKLGYKSDFFLLDKEGFVDLLALEKQLAQNHHKKIFINTTWVHNELGIVEDLAEWKKLKDRYNFFWHVDATQSVFKIANYQKLISGPDQWSFSGHKFGALMGVGWSFIHKNFVTTLSPLILGGDQQRGLRAGTVNVEGILSLQWALESLSPNFSFASARKFLDKIKQILIQELVVSKKGRLFFSEREHAQACNTILFAFNELSADIAMAAFDVAEIYLGTGAACSSGTLKPQATLSILGYDVYTSKSLRLSLDPFLSEERQTLFASQFSHVLKKIVAT